MLPWLLHSKLNFEQHERNSLESQAQSECPNVLLDRRRENSEMLGVFSRITGRRESLEREFGPVEPWVRRFVAKWLKARHCCETSVHS